LTVRMTWQSGTIKCVALDWKDKTVMKITLYVVTYRVKNAPVSYSLLPFPTHQKRTYTRDGQVYDSVSSELKVTVPDGAVIDSDQKLLCWDGEKGKVKSTVNEVYQFVKDRTSGFGPAS